MARCFGKTTWQSGADRAFGQEICGAFNRCLSYTRFMQVTLTPQAEQLLRDALVRNPGSSAAEILEQALADRLMRRNDSAPNDSLRERLKSLPGIKLPAHWPPRFKPVESLKVEGEMPSQRLVQERR
ncbi:MAG: hypothetical protein ABSF71_13265 [Terriglobia bacterium]